MEALNEVRQGLLRPLLDFGEVNADLPLFVVGAELANRPIS